MEEKETNGLDIGNLQINIKVKKLMSLVGFIKTFIKTLETENKEELENFLKGDITLTSFSKILNTILGDFNDDTDEFGEIGKAFFKALSKLTNIKQELLEDLEAQELDTILEKVFNKLKEIKFLNFFINKTKTSLIVTKESNSIEQETEMMMTATDM